MKRRESVGEVGGEKAGWAGKRLVDIAVRLKLVVTLSD